MQGDSSTAEDAASPTGQDPRTGGSPGGESRRLPSIGRSPIGRRSVLAAVGGVLAATAGCLGGGGPSATSDDWEYVEDGPDYGGWFDDTDNFEGTVDWTGEDSVTVDVGAGDQGRLFAPPAIRIDAGTTVTWEWSGAGGPHNVVAENDAFSSGSATAESGHTFQHTFDETGVYRYVCEPHVGSGMVGAVEVV